MGLFDLPAPLYSAIDSLFSALSPLPRLILWAILSGAVSMFFYWLCSRQEKVAAARDRAAQARARLNAYEGHEFGEMWPLATDSLKSSFAHFGVVLGPALLSSLPALTLIVWVSNEFGYEMPQVGKPLVLLPQPAIELNQNSVWDTAYVVTYPSQDAPTEVRTADGDALFTLPLDAAIPVIHKQLWWNRLIGNRAGYLPDAAPVDEVKLWLTRQQFIAAGPSWLRGWEASYFLVLILSSLAIKRLFRIA